MMMHTLTRFLAALEQLRTLDAGFLGDSLGRDREAFERRGWIAPDGYLTHVMVPFLDSEEEVEADIDEDAGVYRYQNPQRRTQVITCPLADIALYAVRLEAFLEHLTQCLAIEPARAARRRSLVPEHLWYLGDRRIPATHAFAPVFFGRRLNRASPGGIAQALADPIFERGGIVLALVNVDRSLPNSHQLRPIRDFLVPGQDDEAFDLAALDRVLRGLPADVGLEPEEWFDEKSGQLKLKHLTEPEQFHGIQRKIISIFWNHRDQGALHWTADVKERSGSVAPTLDKAMGGRARRKTFIDSVSRGRYRLRRSEHFCQIMG